MNKLYTLLATVLLAVVPTFVMADVELTDDYITNASFEEDFDGWTNSGMSAQSNNSFKLKQGKKYAEKWTGKGNAIGNTSVVQTMQQLPAGHYRLTAAAQNIQQDNSAEQTGAVIYAGNAKTTVTASATYEVVFDGTGANMQIGFKCTNATGNWVSTDNFQLFFTGSDAEMLAKNITQAETLLNSDMQPRAKSLLQGAMDAAKAVGDGAAQDDIDAAAVSVISIMPVVRKNVSLYKSLNTALTAANKLTDQTMASQVKTDLLEAIAKGEAELANEQAAYVDAATAKQQIALDNLAVEATTTTLTEASAAARNSHSAYVKLETALTTANNIYDEAKEGAADLKSAIDAAQAVLNGETSSDNDYATATEMLNNAVLAYRVANATGTAPKVKTASLIQGSTVIFARATFSSSSVREKGFCYSTENPEPTIYDNRTTDKWAHYEGSTSRGDIYHIDNLQPATRYYIRAYAISNGYMVGYSDVITTYTLPKAGSSWSYDDAGDAETNQRIREAVAYAIEIINATTQIKNFHLNVHYVPGAGAGGGTADCSYGGYMRISQSTSYQRTGTVLHEGGHGMGVGTTNEWYNNSNYRENTTRGNWLGTRVDRVMDFLGNGTGFHLTGDNTHMWPYGINGAHEDTNAPSLYHANAMIHEALGEDGLIISGSSFCLPAYTFECDGETKYYIKNADANRGLQTAFLRQVAGNRPKWIEMSAEDALANDSCAWYLTFKPATATYEITNAATGAALSTASFTLSGTSTEAARRMQLLPARAKTKSGNYTFASLAYWIVNSSKAFSANAKGVTAAAAFNHANSATTQRWLFLDADEVAKFGNIVGISSPMQTAADFEVSGGKGCVSVSVRGQRTGRSVAIYSIDGRLMERVYVQNGATADIALPRGIYIIDQKKVTVR